jgi:guanosine-3',5'-bis(diphosphate) 3'-pyrophosphohydrolase
MDWTGTARPRVADTARFLRDYGILPPPGNTPEAHALQFRGSARGEAEVTSAQVALPRLLAALDFAAERHSAQRRKGPDAAPYVNHLIEVATLLANVAQVDDVEVLMAGVLHDVLEDTPTTSDEVSARFGARVCKFVQALSDDKSLPRKRRRAIALEELPQMESLVRVIKLADLTSNIKLLPPNWSDERKLEYLEWSESAATICSVECQELAKLYWERAGATRAKLEASLTP